MHVARGTRSPETQARCVRDCGFGVFDDTLPEGITRDVMGVLGANIAAMRAGCKDCPFVGHCSPTDVDSTIAAPLSGSVLALLAKKTNIDPATLEVSTARLDLGLRARHV